MSNDRESNRKPAIKGRMVLLAIAVAIIYWVLESAAHVLVFKRGDIIYEFFTPGAHIVVVRLLVAGSIIIFGVYSQFVLGRRMLAEEALRESEERFRKLSDAAEEGIAIHDGGTIINANEALARMFGYELHELIGMNAEKLATPESLQRTLKHIASGYDKPYEGAGVRKDGTTFHLRLVGKPYQYGDKTLRVATFRDITDRKRAEEALKASEEEKSIVLNSLLELVNYQDTDLKILWANKAGADSVGSEPAELVGRYCYEVWAQRTEPCVGCPVKKTIDTGEPHEKEMTTPDGRIWHIRAFPARGVGGEITGAVEITREITEQRRAEDERRKLDAQIQQMQKLESLGILAGGIAHDFNNLLMGILGFAELAQMELSAESPARQSIEQIEKSAIHAAELTKQLLAYSGKGRFVVEPLNVSKLVEEMQHLLEAVISKKAVLTFDLEEDIPAMEGDATQIRQVLMNLVTNASDAIGEGSGIITIATGAMECDRKFFSRSYFREELPAGIYVYMEVSDTGRGMDGDTKAKIFDPFFSTKFAGRGLGLAAVLGIIRGHKGTIQVHSEPGRGSTFRALFPITEKPAEDAEDVEYPALDVKGRGTILVVDDEEPVRAVAKLILEKNGFQVLTAADGQEGVEIFREYSDRIDAVLLDLTMPRMSGEEVFREISLIRDDIPIILSSGYSEQDATGRFGEKGLAGFIQKPYKPTVLVDKIRMVLKKQQA